MYAPLHVRSHHSLGYGTASPAALAARASGCGYPALALTDLENLYGQVRFHAECRARGVKPLTGVELRRDFDGKGRFGAREGRVVLLARDREGYENLCRIVSDRRAGPEHGLTGDVVEAVARRWWGLWVMSDDVPALERLLASGVEGAVMRVLIGRPGAPAREARLREAARRHGLRCVAAPEVSLLTESDHHLHLLQVAIRRGETLDQVRRGGLGEPPGGVLPDRRTLSRRYADDPELLAESLRVADACDLDLLGGPRIFPEVGLGAGETAAGRLRALCVSALNDRDRRGAAERARLEEELRVIERLGFSGYFLVVAEIVGAARERGIQVAGRGSAVGSLVAHLLGITAVDPIAHGLYFERFLHERRTELPDIDLDLCSRRRDELIDWVYRRFGPERVAMVSTHPTFQPRSAYAEGLKALGMEAAAVERFCRALPGDDLIAALGRDEADSRIPVDRLPEPYRRALPLLDRLVELPRYLAVHPGGVVIADREMAACVPLELAPKGVVVTQYDLRSVEETGLVKIDLLGNRCLSELQEAIELVSDPELRTRGLAGIPVDDPATLRALDRADTIGCFQVESPAVRSVLARLPIRHLGDLVAALALVRPGAAAGRAKEEFIARARGEAAATAPHPALEPYLQDTHGLPLYEEDLMLVLSATARLPLSEADELRAAILSAHGDVRQERRLETEFVERAARAGLDPADACRVWALVLRFAAYSFSKAHASSYALLAYQAVYLRTHFPAEFGCALLNHHAGLYPVRTLAAEIQRWGVPVLPPSVNRAGVECRVDTVAGGRAVRVGLQRVRGLTERTLLRLLRAREESGEFQDMADLERRVDPSRAELAALVRSGACDDLAPLRGSTELLPREAFLEGIQGELPLGGSVGSFATPGGEALERYRVLVRIQGEMKHLRIHLSDHPMRVLRAEAARYGCATTAEARARDGTVRVAALVAATRRARTADGGLLQFVTLEDEHGMLEAVIRPAAYRRLGDRITTPGPFIAEGRVERRGGASYLRVERLDPFHARETVYGRPSRPGRTRTGPPVPPVPPVEPVPRVQPVQAVQPVAPGPRFECLTGPMVNIMGREDLPIPGLRAYAGPEPSAAEERS